MKLTNVGIDFHRNGWLIEKLPKLSKIRLRHGFLPQPTGLTTRLAQTFLENHPKTPKYIADNLFQEENRGLVLLDYYDFESEGKGRKWTNITKKESLDELEQDGYELNTDHLETFLGITKNQGNSWLYLIRGTEAPTLDGHLIAAAIPKTLHFEEHHTKYRGGPSFREKLKEATEEDALVIIPHPLSTEGRLTKAILLAVEDPSNHLGLQEETIRTYAQHIDALEEYSLSMSKDQRQKVKTLAKELNLPLVANSDLPINAGFASYNMFPEIDFTSPESLRGSIRTSLKSRNYERIIEQSPPKLGDMISHVSVVGLYYRIDSA